MREPTSGHVELDGIDLRELRPDSLREHLSVTRSIEIFPGTIDENVRLNRPHITAHDVREALIAVGLTDEILELPDGLNATLQTNGAPLTASQALRLMMARAIVGRPRLLLIDGTLDALSDTMLTKLLPHLVGLKHPWSTHWDVAKAELEAARREVMAAENEVEAKKHELEQKRREAQTKVDYARAMREDAAGQAASTQKERREVEIKRDELDRLTIDAPRDGTIFRLPVYERGQAVKEGDALFTLVPDVSYHAVELWVSGNDTPLVSTGDHVRLQFEGWPAAQFAGWPSVAVGTFGGQVVAVDATDDGMGRFRIQVRPDPDDEPWPSERFLRQGVRANGWVMLSQVPLWYELWRPKKKGGGNAKEGEYSCRMDRSPTGPGSMGW